jgi:hypothetical protein
MDEVLSSSTKAVFAFGVTESLFLNGSDLKVDFINTLTGFTSRLVRDNPNVKHYGFNMLFLFAPPPGSGLPKALEEAENTRSALYSFLANWCIHLSLTIGVVVTFDFVCDEAELFFVLKNELRRVKHGDMAAQFVGAY